MSINVETYAAECAAAGMRGDYARCRDDFTVTQDVDAYDDEDRAVWKTLADRQRALTQELAHHSYLAGLEALGILDDIPDFAEVSRRLYAATGWTLVAVPGLIPAEPFFRHLSERRFLVTDWLRGRDELDYIVEPDMFHDFFGHVPILMQPEFADFMQMYGETALSVMAAGGDEMITRLYWYTAEYGLIQEEGGPLKAFGAGLMSSATELRFALESPDANHVPMDIETIMRTGYEIDSFQRAYFVLPSFEALRQAMRDADIAGIIARYAGEKAIDPSTLRR